jgi:hypothetical protein
MFHSPCRLRRLNPFRLREIEIKFTRENVRWQHPRQRAGSFYALQHMSAHGTFGLDVPPMLLARADEVIE